MISKLFAVAIVRWAALLAGLTVATAASSASGAAIVATYQGQVISGVDMAGIFGTPGSNLGGAPLKIVLTFNSALGRDEFGEIYGGSVWGLPSPLTSALITVGGQTISDPATGFTDWIQNYISLSHDGPHTLLNFGSAFGTSDEYSFIREEISVGGGGGTFTNTPGHFFGSFPPGANGDFHFQGSTSDVLFELTSFDVTGVNVTPGIVPEPGTWVLLLCGIAGIGLLLRRARRPDQLFVSR